MEGIDALLRLTVQEGASDLHVTSAHKPKIRKDGSIVTVEEHDVIPADKMAGFLKEITGEDVWKGYEATGDADFAYAIEGVARFRANLFKDHNGPGAVFRVIPSKIPTAEELNLPPAILDFCTLKKGLVLVTGPTGSGKSTTLAAMVDHILKTREDHVLTIEDPIEFLYPSGKSLVNQREVGRDTESFKRALRAALREDPDIVLVGEMRDLETVEIAIETAETGHLVFGTLHTTTAASTVNRIVDQFPADRQSQIRTMLADSLRGVVSQNLCKRKEKGRVAAMEILISNPAISNNIREGKIFGIVNAMEVGKSLGMQTLSNALLTLVQSDLITPEEALIRCADKQEMRAKLGSAGIAVKGDSDDLDGLGDDSLKNYTASDVL